MCGGGGDINIPAGPTAQETAAAQWWLEQQRNAASEAARQAEEVRKQKKIESNRAQYGQLLNQLFGPSMDPYTLETISPTDLTGTTSSYSLDPTRIINNDLTYQPTADLVNAYRPLVGDAYINNLISGESPIVQDLLGKDQADRSMLETLESYQAPGGVSYDTNAYSSMASSDIPPEFQSSLLRNLARYSELAPENPLRSELLDYGTNIYGGMRDALLTPTDEQFASDAWLETLRPVTERATATDIINSFTGKKRHGYEQDWSKIAPYGFENTAFGPTTDDPILQAILANQQQSASTQLYNALQTGQMSKPAYDWATTQLGNQATEGNARLQQLGGDVLAGYRGQLADTSNQARNAISGWTLGDTFSLDPYKTQLGSLQTDLSGRLEGDIRAALGDTNLFDISGLISRAGATVGAQNLPTPSLLSALEERKKRSEQNRGLGTQGVF